jgi:hypothetical protein
VKDIDPWKTYGERRPIGRKPALLRFFTALPFTKISTAPVEFSVALRVFPKSSNVHVEDGRTTVNSIKIGSISRLMGS